MDRNFGMVKWLAGWKCAFTGRFVESYLLKRFYNERFEGENRKCPYLDDPGCPVGRITFFFMADTCKYEQIWGFPWRTFIIKDFGRWFYLKFAPVEVLFARCGAGVRARRISGSRLLPWPCSRRRPGPRPAAVRTPTTPTRPPPTAGDTRPHFPVCPFFPFFRESTKKKSPNFQINSPNFF